MINPGNNPSTIKPTLIAIARAIMLSEPLTGTTSAPDRFKINLVVS